MITRPAIFKWRQTEPGIILQIAKKYSVSRDGVYRHAHAFGLIDKRRRNVRTALERIIEKAGEVDVTAAAVVAAVQAYSKIIAAGQWVDRSQHINLNELFERMTTVELEATPETVACQYPHRARCRFRGELHSASDTVHRSAKGVGPQQMSLPPARRTSTVSS